MIETVCMECGETYIMYKGMSTPTGFCGKCKKQNYEPGEGWMRLPKHPDKDAKCSVCNQNFKKGEEYNVFVIYVHSKHVGGDSSE